jgi:hypothetical protein
MKDLMKNKTPNIQNKPEIWLVSGFIFLAVALYLLFMLQNIPQAIIWFGAAISFFYIALKMN